LLPGSATRTSGQKKTFPERKKAAYLERQKLLSDDEREALPTDAFEPVSYFLIDRMGKIQILSVPLIAAGLRLMMHRYFLQYV